MNNRFQIITHANGTSTLRDTVVGQEMHSRLGPWNEAQILYAKGSQIVEKLAQQKSIHLHDVGMGTSANVLACLDSIEKSEKDLVGYQLTVQSFETHLDGTRFALENLETFPFLKDYEKTLQALLEKKTLSFTLPKSKVVVNWSLFEGDYYRFLSEAALPDLIFYDFYSIKAEPELWSEEKFQALRVYLGDHACELYTYSAATPVRLALLLSGFFIGSGATTEMKTDTTVAATRRDLLLSPLGQKFLDKLKVSSSIESEELRERGILAFKNLLQ